MSNLRKCQTCPNLVQSPARRCDRCKRRAARLARRRAAGRSRLARIHASAVLAPRLTPDAPRDWPAANGDYYATRSPLPGGEGLGARESAR